MSWQTDCPHKDWIDKSMELMEKRMESLEKKIDDGFTKLFNKIETMNTAITELKTERDIKNRNTPYVITAITIGVNAVIFFITKFFRL